MDCDGPWQGFYGTSSVTAHLSCTSGDPQGLIQGVSVVQRGSKKMNMLHFCSVGHRESDNLE